MFFGVKRLSRRDLDFSKDVADKQVSLMEQGRKSQGRFAGILGMIGKKLIGRRFYLHVAYLWAVETGMHVGVELELLAWRLRVSFAGLKRV